MRFIQQGEIKFRDYDLDTNTIRYFDLDSYNGNEHDNYSNITLFTGLKDKNGVEIFEGDFVKWIFGKHYWEAIISKVNNNKSNTLYAIETYHNCTTNEEENIYTYERSDSRRGSRNDIEYLSKNLEVIGNIYLNPELLTDNA